MGAGSAVGRGSLAWQGLMAALESASSGVVWAVAAAEKDVVAAAAVAAVAVWLVTVQALEAARSVMESGVTTAFDDQMAVLSHKPAPRR